MVVRYQWTLRDCRVEFIAWGFKVDSNQSFLFWSNSRFPSWLQTRPGGWVEMPLVVVIKIYLVIALLLHYNYTITTRTPLYY